MSKLDKGTHTTGPPCDTINDGLSLSGCPSTDLERFCEQHRGGAAEVPVPGWFRGHVRGQVGGGSHGERRIHHH